MVANADYHNTRRKHMRTHMITQEERICRLEAKLAALKSPKLPRRTVTVGSIGFDLITVPDGQYMKGSPESDPGRFWDEVQTKVSIKKFDLMETLVPEELWNAVMGDDPETDNPKMPKSNVSYFDVQEFSKKLSEITGIEFYGPSSDEWEYAARAGTKTAYWWGDEPDHAYATFDTDGPTPVDFNPPNPWGFIDMSGNLWEWTRTEYRA